MFIAERNQDVEQLDVVCAGVEACLAEYDQISARPLQPVNGSYSAAVEGLGDTIFEVAIQALRFIIGAAIAITAFFIGANLAKYLANKTGGKSRRASREQYERSSMDALSKSLFGHKLKFKALSQAVAETERRFGIFLRMSRVGEGSEALRQVEDRLNQVVESFKNTLNRKERLFFSNPDIANKLIEASGVYIVTFIGGAAETHRKLDRVRMNTQIIAFGAACVNIESACKKTTARLPTEALAEWANGAANWESFFSKYPEQRDAFYADVTPAVDKYKEILENINSIVELSKAQARGDAKLDTAGAAGRVEYASSDDKLDSVKDFLALLEYAERYCRKAEGHLGNVSEKMRSGGEVEKQILKDVQENKQYMEKQIETLEASGKRRGQSEAFDGGRYSTVKPAIAYYRSWYALNIAAYQQWRAGFNELAGDLVDYVNISGKIIGLLKQIAKMKMPAEGTKDFDKFQESLMEYIESVENITVDGTSRPVPPALPLLA